MYKSFSSIILNRFEALNVRLLSQIANARPRIRISATPGPSTDIGRGATPGLGSTEDDPMLGKVVVGEDKGRERSGTPGVKGVVEGASTGGASGGGKKKKKGKR